MKDIVNQNYFRWLESNKVSKEDKKTLLSMNKEEKDDAFFKNIDFGTAGIRGKIGPGTNRINSFIVRKATIGFALYLKELFLDTKIKVGISHDNRHYSREFTLLSADILNDLGIDTYIFDSLRPTPELSYLVRHLSCQGGIMITASHNPKEYNGYKVYDENGCQLTPFKIKRLIEIINGLDDELSLTYEKSLTRGVNTILDKEIDDSYVNEVKKITINKDLDKKGFKIVYSPNHGTSYENAIRVFKEEGYEIYPVKELSNPDPDFTLLSSPNPEDPNAYSKCIEYAKEINADLITMTDPDGDRVGVATKLNNNEYALINGNEGATLLLDYILSNKKINDIKKYVVYNTVVSSMIGKKICDYYGVRLESFLTGFKFIGDRIAYYEERGNKYQFLFGYEESYGCLIAPFVRDKDGIQAILLYSEMALFYKKKGMNLVDAYIELSKKLGKYYSSKQFSIYFEGSLGKENMDKLMEKVKLNPFKELLGNKVVVIEDYFDLVRLNLETNKKETIENLPKGDLVKFYFEDGTNISIRPSGTEPKCKFYIEVVGNNESETKNKHELYFEEIKKFLL